MLFSLACADGEEPSAADPEQAWRDAPLRIEPGAGEGEAAVLVAPEATVTGVGRGWLVIEGGSLRVDAGAVGAQAFEPDDADALRIVAEPVDVPELPPELEASPGVASLDARAIALDRVVIDEYEHARLLGGEALHGPLEIEASALLWDEIDGRLVFDEDEDAPRVELGHTVGIGGVGVHIVTPRGGGVTAPIGSPCIATADCDPELACVEEIAQPGFVCAAVCVESNADDALRCSDDAGCCDAAAVCDDAGVCVVSSADDGGTPPPEDADQEGGCNEACGDRDDDNVRNGCDQKPDESCSADSDNDGCKDSCDANDEDGSDGCFGGGDDGDDGFFCRIPRLPRPNSTFYAFVLLFFVRGRRRRRA
jgi:hypothetical protein